MSITYRTKRLSEFVAPQTQTSPIVATKHQGDAEAPERAVEPREAPESRATRHAEAPDAGEGRRHHTFEQEFTHGRSQS
jgi:hypothetical protein